MKLSARVIVDRDAMTLDADVSFPSGEVTAIVGPNGSGKSTLLLAIAGLVALRSGRVALDGQVLEDVATGARLEPEDRLLGLVFQDRLLFPHLSAVDNVAFGLRARGMARGPARRRAVELLEEMGLAERGSALPAELSGGEAQRVAIARALATDPAALLLDEPLAALDAGARRTMRGELRRHLQAFGGVGVIVTHDLVDAVAITDHVVVLEEGRVVQSGAIPDVCARPRSGYVAEFVGMNLLRGHARGGRIEVHGGGVVTATDTADGDVFALIHPRSVALYRERPDGSPRNVWLGVVAAVDEEGARARVSVDGPPALVAEVTTAALRELALGRGSRVWVVVKATEVAAYPDE